MRNDSWALGSSTINQIEEGLLALEPVRRQYRMPAILLVPGQVTLGSAGDCTISLKAEGVMPRHCLIESNAKRTVLFAENARTWHNDGPVRETDLRPGDRLAIGPVEFRVRLATADELLTLIPDEILRTQPHSTGRHSNAISSAKRT